MTKPPQIPFFNYPDVFVTEEEDLVSIFCDVGRRGAFILQNEVSDFERSIANYVGVKYALGVANATDGLILGLRAAGLQPGDEVIFSSHTFVATAAAIHFVGATPIPVECGSDHLIDPLAVKRAVTLRTKAILPTQLNGRTCKMDILQNIADQHGLLIIEDAAQGLGSLYKGKPTGSFGAVAAISFYPAKNLGCFGDGGIVLTNDERLYGTMKLLRDHGRDPRGEVLLWGMNSRLDNLQAAILSYKFKKYEMIVTRRREVAVLYHEYLSNLKQLVLPPPPNIDPNHFDVFQNYEIEAERRDALKANLAEHGIGTLIQWSGKPVHQFLALGFNQKLPYTDWLFERLLMLPMNLSITDEQVKYVADTIRNFYS